MADGTNITRDELLELAVADAAGTLAEVDSARFERAFESASPSMQAEIRAVQDRVALDPVFLSSELPQPSLRLKVLARVASAIEEQASAAQPIATIGPSGSRARRAATAAQSSADGDRDATRREIIERSSRETQPVQHAWRAAALFLFAALMVALYFNAEQRRISDRLIDFVDRQLTDSAAREVAQLASGFDVASARALVVRDGSGAAVQHIHAYVDAETDRVFVYGMGLNDPGRAVFVRSGVGGQPLTLAASALADRGFALVFQVPEAHKPGGSAAPAPLRLEIGESVYTIQV